MKMHPLLLVALALMYAVPFSAILLHFAWEPDRFSSEALYFTLYITFPIFYFVIFLLGRSDGSPGSTLIWALGDLLKRKIWRAGELSQEAIDLPNIFAPASSKLTPNDVTAGDDNPSTKSVVESRAAEKN
jgi:hypothetical protein